MPRHSSASPLSAVLSGVLGNLRTDQRPSIEEMTQVWRRVAGEAAARHSWPKRILRQRLVIGVENSGWMYSLNLRSRDLLEGLVELMGCRRVRELGFQMGDRVRDA